ncbi:MAG: hypothetical protein LH603_07165 [Pseudonocardia sp.]|nr:hypothetical protein [Pseudonocardia sp.]
MAVVALVDPDRPESVIALLDSGADDSVTVPFHPDEVVARLRAHLRRRAQHDTGMVGTPGGRQNR